jgi:glutathione reductase (NADPH)
MTATVDTSYDCDLFVIGAGSGGVRASRMASQLGAKVILAEGSALGGTCVNLGCIPKKLYSYAAHYHEAFAQARGFGWALAEPVFDWDVLKARRGAEITRLNGVYAELLRGANVQLVRGWAKLLDAHTVAVKTTTHEQRFTARHILLATGGEPLRIEGPGAQWAMSSDDMFDLSPFPKRLVVVGGGYIACEFASIFHGLGSKVTLLHRGPQLLRGFDGEMARFVTAEMRKKGIDIRLESRIAAVERRGEVQRLQLADDSVLEADTVLHATGRRARSRGLGLAEVGVKVNEDCTVPVDEGFTTNVPSVHALGDLVGHKALTPVALAEAMVLIDRLFGDGRRPALDYATVPTAIFTHPQAATVGLSEEVARTRHGMLRIYRSEFKPLQHTLSGSTERTLLKLVVDDASDRLLGAHMVGGDAGEVLQGFAVAVQAGLTKAQLDRTIGIHPTVAEEFVTMRVAASRG